jgi:hypothetical protein
MRNTITKLITLTMAVAAIAVVGSIFKTEAQEVRVLRGTALAGFISEQTLRLNMANLSTREEGGGPVRAQVKLFDSQGNVIASSREVAVLPGQFTFFDFNCDDLAVAGEPNTGRVQVGVDFQFQADANQTFSPKDFPVTMEVMDSRTGSGHLYGGDYFTGTVTVSDD